MKKDWVIVGVLVGIILTLLLFAGVIEIIKNKTFHYDQAIVRLEGEIYYDIPIMSWKKNNNKIEILDTNGTVYLTDLTNVILLGNGRGVNDEQ